MTNVERYINAAKLVAEINPQLSVGDVLSKAAELLAIAGPQPRVKRQPAKPARTRVEKTEAA